jgi:hypothetical protein
MKGTTESTNVTSTKSKYFEDPESDEAEDPSSEEAEESGYEDGDTSAAEVSPSSESESEEEDTKPKRAKTKGRTGQTKTGAGVGGRLSAVIEQGRELWRHGVKAGLGPGKQVFIEKPKPRGDGGIMLALVYLPKWYRSPMRLTLPASVRDEVKKWGKVDFEAGTDWVDGEVQALGSAVPGKLDTGSQIWSLCQHRRKRDQDHNGDRDRARGHKTGVLAAGR